MRSSEGLFMSGRDKLWKTRTLGPLNPRTFYLEPHVEQLADAQVPQDELAVLLNFPPLEKAKDDITRFTFLLLHSGQAIFSEELKTNFSNS